MSRLSILQAHYKNLKARMKASPPSKRDGFRMLAYRKYPNQRALVDEYIDEAEHQEGLEYWSMFSSEYEVMRDFEEYIRASGE